MRLAIRHRTAYEYGGTMGLVLERLRLWPRSDTSQEVIAWEVRVEGGSEQARFRDAHGNRMALYAMDEHADALRIEVGGEVETRVADGVLGETEGPPLWLYRRPTPLTAPQEGAARLAARFEPSDALGSLHRLSDAIRESVAYEIGATGPTTSAEEALALGRGVCQDHAHAFLAAARLAGVPARYVSGYLKMNDRDNQDATHAWAEAHVAGLGWVGFDVSNGYSPDERYVRLAVGLDYRDAAPVSGLVRGTRSEALTVTLSVRQMQQSQQ